MILATPMTRCGRTRTYCSMSFIIGQKWHRVCRIPYGCTKHWFWRYLEGHGLVSIRHPEIYGLDDAMMMRPTGTGIIEPVYQISFFHALHCLVCQDPYSFIRKVFRNCYCSMGWILVSKLKSNILRSHANLRQGKLQDSISTEHTAHCFDYLRQHIICAGHTKLEGDTAAKGYVKPWGTIHVCKKYSEIVEWADMNSPWEFSDDSTLWVSFFVESWCILYMYSTKSNTVRFSTRLYCPYKQSKESK